MTIELAGSLAAWPREDFVAVIKQELLSKTADLPLHKGVAQGGMVDAGNMDLTVTKAVDRGDRIQVWCGVFFTEIVGGCSCGDDPAAQHAYCEMEILIDKATAMAELRVRPG